ncbi:hypothetical protein TRIUR3_15555 [Triticum urartu]|uniref:Uncharacterized protein n=2 Tax=Triticum TaxID=4564 RepID=A0A9R0S8X4_TRITD|nr:hypothetical protein TRIUR3_15555 [Triticum urartu]VAH88636.1 unnamed protein product [Triticum turgidum subsp. durum]
MKSGSGVQEACEDQVSEISSQAASNNNEASNTSSRPKLALDLSLTVTATAAATTTAESSTTDSNGGAQAAREPTRTPRPGQCGVDTPPSPSLSAAEPEWYDGERRVEVEAIAAAVGP